MTVAGAGAHIRPALDIDGRNRFSGAAVTSPPLPADWMSEHGSPVFRPAFETTSTGVSRVHKGQSSNDSSLSRQGPSAKGISSSGSDVIRRLWQMEDSSQLYATRSTFIQAVSSSSEDLVLQGVRRKVELCLTAPCVEWFFGLVILLNFILIVLETDWRASTSASMPVLYTNLATVFLVIYCVEVLMRIYCFRLEVFRNPWTVLDMVTVVAGASELVFDLTGNHINGSSAFRAMRLVRLLRLLRALKFLNALRELRKLLEMMASCFRTLFWSFLLCFLVMSLWSIVAVELLSDIVQEMHDDGVWADCAVCGRYLTSVMHCNLFFFQTIIAGDSWGVMSVPVVERHPWSMIIFGGALLTIVFGVLQLVVAVVVDTFADLRAKDLRHMALELEMEEHEEKKALFKIFEKIDQDRSGEVSYQELESGAQRVPELRQRLRVLDIDRMDLRHLFFMLDRDGSGEIDREEFIETMYRVKNTEPKTATKIMKHYMMQMLPKIAHEQRSVQGSIDTLAQISKSLESNIEELSSARRDVDRRINEFRRKFESHEASMKEELGTITSRVVTALEQPPRPPSATSTWAARNQALTELKPGDRTCPTDLSKPEDIIIRRPAEVSQQPAQSSTCSNTYGRRDVDRVDFSESLSGGRFLHKGASQSRSHAPATVVAERTPPPPPPMPPLITEALPRAPGSSARASSMKINDSPRSPHLNSDLAGPADSALGS